MVLLLLIVGKDILEFDQGQNQKKWVINIRFWELAQFIAGISFKLIALSWEG